MSGVELTRAVSLALESLGSEDRFLRAAARVALESQPTESWSTQVLQSDSAQIRITGAVALARVGEPELQSTVVESLNALDLSKLTRQQQLGWFRAQGLAMLRLGKPNSEQREIIIGKVHKLFPSTDGDINTESIRILVALKDSKVIEPATQLIAKRGEPSIPDWSELASRNSRYGGTVNALLNNHPPSLEIGYALMLRNLRSGWTLAQRRIYPNSSTRRPKVRVDRVSPDSSGIFGRKLWASALMSIALHCKRLRERILTLYRILKSNRFKVRAKNGR